MEWNGKWYGMEGEFWYGIWKVLRMEWNEKFEKWKGRSSSILPYQLHTYCVYENLQQITKKYHQTRMRIISHLSVLQCKFLARCDCIVLLRKHQYHVYLHALKLCSFFMFFAM